ASRSNKLMRLRVLAQAVVIGVLVLIGLAVGAIGS
ncbi:MAG: HIG1 domain-containing protein, partial [Henriciella sp.]